MDIYSLVSLANAKVNAVARVVLYVYTILKERLVGNREVSTSKIDFSQHTKYPYTLLRAYDLILRWNNFSAWNMSNLDLQAFFDANVSKCHLDVGVGSGYYPSHSKQLKRLFQEGGVELELWDLNPGPLQYASARIKSACGDGVKVTTRQVNLLDKAVIDVPLKFTSVSMDYVFHCVVYPEIEASNEEKAIEKFHLGFQRVKQVMADGGIVSGVTLIDVDDPGISPHYSRFRLALARGVMRDMQFNVVHFYNQYDTMNAIEEGAKRAGLKRKTTFTKGVVAHFVFEK